MSDARIPGHWVGRMANLVVVAAVLNLGCDLMLFAGPGAGSVIADPEPLMRALGSGSPLRLYLGAGLGTVLISLWWWLLPALQRLLQPCPRLLPWVLGAYTLFVGCCAAFHASFGFLGVLGQLGGRGAMDLGAAVPLVQGAMATIQVPMLLSMLVFSLGFALAAVSAATPVPRWGGLLTPLLLCTLLPGLATLLPAPAGAAVAMIASTLGLSLFFLFVRWCWGRT